MGFLGVIAVVLIVLAFCVFLIKSTPKPYDYTTDLSRKHTPVAPEGNLYDLDEIDMTKKSWPDNL